MAHQHSARHDRILPAVKQTATALGISQARAKAKIIAAGYAKDIEGVWRDYARRNQLIARGEWAGADIDVRSDVLILADGTRKALVVLDRKEFEAWLSDELELVQEAQTKTLPDGDQAEADSDQAEGSGGHKAALVRNAAREIFGSSALKNLPPQVVFDKVASYVQKKHGVTVSKTHTLESLGLKKSRRAI
jgi:hypothetical protein